MKKRKETTLSQTKKQYATQTGFYGRISLWAYIFTFSISVRIRRVFHKHGDYKRRIAEMRNYFYLKIEEDESKGDQINKSK